MEEVKAEEERAGVIEVTAMATGAEAVAAAWAVAMAADVQAVQEMVAAEMVVEAQDMVMQAELRARLAEETVGVERVEVKKAGAVKMAEVRVEEETEEETPEEAPEEAVRAMVRAEGEWVAETVVVTKVPGRVVVVSVEVELVQADMEAV